MVEEPYGLRLTLVYEPGEDVRSRSGGRCSGVLVSEFVGEGADRYVEKLVGGGTRVERVQVGPYPAFGSRVALMSCSSRATAECSRTVAGWRNTLLVEHNDVLVRIEGELSRERALEIAASLALELGGGGRAGLVGLDACAHVQGVSSTNARAAGER